MTTSVELTEQELAEIKQFTSEKEASAAIRMAMKEYIRFVRRMRLKELSGKVEMTNDWRNGENAEMGLESDEPGPSTC